MSKDIAAVGLTVHYTSLGSAPQDGVQQYPSKCRAAVITEIVDIMTGVVHLTVMNPEGFQFAKDVPFDVEFLALNGGPTPGAWHFPEKPMAPLVGGAMTKDS